MKEEYKKEQEKMEHWSIAPFVFHDNLKTQFSERRAFCGGLIYLRVIVWISPGRGCVYLQQALVLLQFVWNLFEIPLSIRTNDIVWLFFCVFPPLRTEDVFLKMSQILKNFMDFSGATGPRIGLLLNAQVLTG